MTKITQSQPVLKGRRHAARTSVQHVITDAKRAATMKAAAPRKPGKLDKVIAMMRHPKGATIAELSKATDWQAHSVRGAISGAIKKKHNLKVVSEKSGDVRTNRIASLGRGWK